MILTGPLGRTDRVIQYKLVPKRRSKCDVSILVSAYPVTTMLLFPVSFESSDSPASCTSARGCLATVVLVLSHPGQYTHARTARAAESSLHSAAVSVAVLQVVVTILNVLKRMCSRLWKRSGKHSRNGFCCY